MRYTVIFTLLALSASSPGLFAQVQLATSGNTPPVAPKIPKDVTVHGDTRIDNYFWLRDRTNPAVIDYLSAEDRYTDAVMAPTGPLRDELFKEMLGRIRETDSSAPYPDGAWLYYYRTLQGKQYRVYCRKPRQGDAGAEQVLVDLNELGKGGKFIGMEAYEVSNDGNLLAYSIDKTGHRDYELFVKDLRTGSLVPQKVGTVSSVAWAADNATLFFTQEEPVSKRSYKLGRCDLGTGKIDILYEEKDENYVIGLGASLDRKYLFCESESKLTSEVRALPADMPRGEWKVLDPRRADHKYGADHREGLFYIVTNKDAKNYKVVTTPVATPGEDHWTDFVPADPGVKVDDITLFAKYAVVTERRGGLPRLKVIEFATGASHEIPFPEPSYEARLAVNAEYDSPVVRFSYQSPVTAPSVFAYDMGTRERSLVKQDEVLGGYAPKDYACERIFAKATDGTEIPVTLVYRRELREKGPQKLLLYGYGSYGFSLPDTFSSSRLSLLDRGVIYAVAHVRGGGELGEPWRDAGRMKEKMTTFTDFISCAQFLIAQGYTTPRRMATSGGSAGGLLMGAVLNLRPDLFRVAVLKVPFVDVVNTMLDASLPLTTEEYTEWGNPNVAEEYSWIRAYSPYDNIRAQAYPAILVTTALNDSQVPYWEGCKYVAKLRATKTDSNVLLLKVNLDPAGHGGASGRYDALHEVAFDYAFTLTELSADSGIRMP
jgi:oligopeptidase B